MSEASNTLSTSDRILEAAAEVFTRQGFAATTTRDIAQAAGVNIATLHYHHQSKEALFARVAELAMVRFNAVFDEVHARGMGLRPFVYGFLDGYTELLLDYPYLAGFIQHESEAHPERFVEHADFADWSRKAGEMIRVERGEAMVDPLRTGHFIASMVGALVYPFLFRKTTMHEFGMDEAAFAGFVRERQTVVAEMVLGSVLG